MRRLNNNGFSFIVPLAIVITIAIACLALGAYTVSEINDNLYDTYPENVKSGSISSTYWHNATSNSSRNITLTSPNTVEQLSGGASKFYILANGSFNIYYNLTVNGVAVNTSSKINKGDGYNWTVTALIAAGALTNGASYINYSWDVNSTESQIYIRTSGAYYDSNDFRTVNENNTILLLGNITEGFSDTVDVEVVVIIITALSLALFTILTIGSRRNIF